MNFITRQHFRSGILDVIIILIIFGIFSELRSQEKFILDENDMPGYKLIDQFSSSWKLDNNKYREAIIQTWEPSKGNNLLAIIVSYCIFDSELEAITGTAYNSGTYANIFYWGSFDGSICGDLSWISYQTLLSVRGNVGITIGRPGDPNLEELKVIKAFNDKALNKIEANLSYEIISFEENAKQKQIPRNEFNKLTDQVISENMGDFYKFTSWDSKWLPDTSSMTMGIRTEWKNENGTLVGIDICKFDNKDQAQKAAVIQGAQTYSPIFNIDSLASLQKIIEKWENETKFGFENNLFSVITTKGNLSIHIYQFDSTKINTDFTYSIIVKLAEQISNF